MNNQMMKECREAYVEVLEILKHMEKKYVAKIPLELREFFERNASEEYKFYIDKSIPLEEHKLKSNTINILAMINLNYWCESEEHKQELLRKYYENDIKHQEELKNKYNTDNLFKRERKTTYFNKKADTNSLPLEHKKAKWYKNVYEVIVNFIKRIIHK